MTIFEIKNPKDDEGTPAPFASILANMATQSPAGFFRKLIFGHKDPALFLEISVIKQSIRFHLISDDYLKSYFYSQLSAQYPTAEIIESKEYLPLPAHFQAIAYGQLKLRNVYYYPVQTYANFKDQDPMTSMLSILSKLKEDEFGFIQMVLMPAGTTWQTGARRIIEKGIEEKGPNNTIKRKSIPNESAISEKITINGLKTSIRLFIGAQNEKKAKSLLTDLAGSFSVVARGDGNSFALVAPGIFTKKKFLKSIFDRTPLYIPHNQVLNVDEIATLFHPPSLSLEGIMNISWGGQLMSEAPENLPITSVFPTLQEGLQSEQSVDNTGTPPDELPTTSDDKRNINFFARTTFKNEMRTFGIKREDRTRHMYFIGKTGTGKSTLISNMVISDMRNGEGLAIIDPHGDLCDTILDYVPKNRINDVAYLDPSDVEHAFRLNPLELSQGAGVQVDQYGAEMVASGIVSIFYKLYANSWGPRMEYILRNTLLTMTQVPNSTLHDVVRMLSEQKFRTQTVKKLVDPILINFWENEFDKMGDKLRAEAVAPIQNKIGQFVSSPMIRNIIGHPKSTVNFADMMNEGKIVICNLSQGKLGEDNAALLGAMFITKMQLAAMSRVYMPAKDRRDFYLYVDEFQNFATTSFLKILSEARKYRLNLILANQYIGQIDLDVQKAIFGNVGSLVSFLIGANDAKALSSEFGENYEPKDFVNLDNYRILLKMAINGRTSMPFFAQTLPLPASKNKNREKIIRVSRERYGITKSGFTMIELLIVVAIIAILSVAAMFWGVGALERAKVTKSIAQIQEIQRAYALYRIDTQRIPANNDLYDENPFIVNPGIPGWRGPYADEHALPNVHAWGGHLGWIGENPGVACNGTVCPDYNRDGEVDFIIYFDDDRPGTDYSDNGGQMSYYAMEKIDQVLDDGNLSTGNVTGNGALVFPNVPGSTFASAPQGEVVIVVN